MCKREKWCIEKLSNGERRNTRDDRKVQAHGEENKSREIKFERKSRKRFST
jgi:hypothetical protein